MAFLLDLKEYAPHAFACIGLCAPLSQMIGQRIAGRTVQVGLIEKLDLALQRSESSPLLIQTYTMALFGLRRSLEEMRFLARDARPFAKIEALRRVGGRVRFTGDGYVCTAWSYRRPWPRRILSWGAGVVYVVAGGSALLLPSHVGLLSDPSFTPAQNIVAVIYVVMVLVCIAWLALQRLLRGFALHTLAVFPRSGP